jgi:hypothetical protein
MAGKTTFTEKQVLNRWFRKLTTTATAGGSGVTLNVTSSTGFQVGDIILLVGATPANFMTQVVAVPNGTSLTLAYAPTTTPTSGNVVAVAWSPVAVYVGLFSVAPTDAGGGTEWTGGNYARQAIAQADASWNAPAGSPSAMTNVATPTWTAITWTGLPGNIVAWGLFDALTGGNLIGWLAITSQAVAATNNVVFNAGAITVTED